MKAAALGAKGANVIAALVVMTVETCRDSYMVASGRMKLVEMAQGLGQSLFATVCMFAGLGVASVLAPEAAVPDLIGSLWDAPPLNREVPASCVFAPIRDSRSSDLSRRTRGFLRSFYGNWTSREHV